MTKAERARMLADTITDLELHISMLEHAKSTAYLPGTSMTVEEIDDLLAGEKAQLERLQREVTTLS